MFESNKFRVLQRERRFSPFVRRSLEKKLGFPLKPKEPLAPYFRFLREMRPQIALEYPNMTNKERVALIAKNWESLTEKEKEKFAIDYKNEIIKFSKALANYNNALTADQKTMIKEKIEEIGKKKLILFYKKKARELNKPKKPTSSFLRFLHEQKDRQPNERYKDHIKRVSQRWMALSITKKRLYKTPPEEFENYKKAMLAWEATILAMEAERDENKILRREPEKYDENEYEDEEEKNFPSR